MDFNERMRQAYFAGVTNGDWFPRGKCVGIYCPDWDSQFVLTECGKIFLDSHNSIWTKTAFFSRMSIKGRGVRILKWIKENRSMHEISNILGDKFVSDAFSDFDGTHLENSEFCATVTWLLQNGYILRIIDKSI